MSRHLSTPYLRAGKNNKLNFFVPPNGPCETPPFSPQNSPRKSLCGSLFCVLSQEMRHINVSLVARHSKRVYVEKNYMLCLSPTISWWEKQWIHIGGPAHMVDSSINFKRKGGGGFQSRTKAESPSEGHRPHNWCMFYKHPVLTLYE